MTPKEHSLMIFMFARQTMLIKSLVEMMKSRGVLEDDDWVAFDAFVRNQEVAQQSKVSDAVAKQYQEFAQALGVQTGLLGP